MAESTPARRELHLGFDVDGVLANFVSAYERLCITITGKNLFGYEPGHPEAVAPPCWDWPQHYGYTSEEVGAVWDAIKQDESFNANLDPMDGADDLWVMGPTIEAQHRAYFITARVGPRVKQITERWLQQHCGFKNPTVLIATDKGACAKALGLHAYIDDNADNVNRVVLATEGTTDVYLLDAAYNRPGAAAPVDVRVRRIAQLREMLIPYGIRP